MSLTPGGLVANTSLYYTLRILLASLLLNLIFHCIQLRFCLETSYGFLRKAIWKVNLSSSLSMSLHLSGIDDTHSRV